MLSVSSDNSSIIILDMLAMSESDNVISPRLNGIVCQVLVAVVAIIFRHKSVVVVVVVVKSFEQLTRTVDENSWREQLAKRKQTVVVCENFLQHS
jgi:hypothetical protein